MSKKHKKQKQKIFIDEHGVAHCVIEPTNVRNEMHFNIQRNTRATYIELKKFKKPKHKKKLFEEE